MVTTGTSLLRGRRCLILCLGDSKSLSCVGSYHHTTCVRFRFFLTQSLLSLKHKSVTGTMVPKSSVSSLEQTNMLISQGARSHYLELQSLLSAVSHGSLFPFSASVAHFGTFCHLLPVLQAPAPLLSPPCASAQPSVLFQPELLGELTVHPPWLPQRLPPSLFIGVTHIMLSKPVLFWMLLSF